MSETPKNKNLESIFLSALEIDSPEQQTAFVAEACGADSALRGEVEELLKSNSAAGSFLQKPAPEMGATLLVSEADMNRSAAMEAGLAAAFEGEQAVVVGNAGLSVLKSLSVTLDVPRVALRESAHEPVERVLRASSPEMPQKDSDSRYQLQGEIARGGMGAILKGRDTDLCRDLAIKVLLDAHKDKPDVVQRFIEEAQIGGQLQHPGIAPVYELGQFADRRPFFSMKLVKGETFSKLLEERENPAVDRGRFVGIFEQICQTVAYAHSRGVIHRDLKPANIMVGAFGEVQVMDWGLAKVLQSGGIADEKKAKDKQQGQSIIRTLRSRMGSDPSSHARQSVGDTSAGSDIEAHVLATVATFGSETMAGSVMGTPAYMPPEQALGEIDNLDERADVFGLGAILCEILTGKPPYVGTDGTQVYRMATRGKLADCFARLDASGQASAASEPQGASRGSGASQAPAASAVRLTNAVPADAELIAIAKQCLEIEPKDRPRDASVLAERITAHLASVESRLHAAELNHAAEAARAEEALQTAKEHELAASAERRARKLQMGLAAVVLCVLTVGGIAATWTAAVQSQLKNEALLAEQTATKARKQAEQEQARAESEKTRAETEKTRAEVAQRQAEDEKTRSLNLLADMQTERGLQAGREGQAANAALWFANAAKLTPHDRERQVANQRRAQTWSGEALLPVAMLKLSSRDVDRIEFQPGGALLLTVSQNGLRVWDWRNEVALPWSEQFPAVSDAAMSPDGKRIAALLSTGEVRLVDPATGEPNALASGGVLSNDGVSRNGGVLPAASAGGSRRFNTANGMSVIEWSPDGARVAVAGKQLQIWNVSGAPVLESDWTHPAKIGGVRFSRSGQRIVSSGEDALARVFAINEASLPAPLYPAIEHRPGIRWREAVPVFCDDDGRLVTINVVTFQPALRNATTGRLISDNWKMTGYFHTSLDLSPDGRWIAVGGYKDGALLSADGKTSLILPHANHLSAAMFAPNGQSLATLGYEGIARLFPLRDLGKADVGAPTIIPQQNTIANGAFSSDSHALAVASNNQVVVWERRPASPIVGQVAWADHSWRPRPSSDGQLVTPGVYHEYYSGFAPKKADLKVARMADGSAAGPAIALTGLLLDSCISSDNASVAAVTVDQTRGWLSLFDIATGTAKWPALALPALPLSVATRPGRPQLAVLCQNGDLLVVDATHGAAELRQTHPGVSGPATNARVAYSPDGATIVAVLQNQHVAIRDAQTGEPRCSTFNPQIQGGWTRSIAFSPDSRLLATAVSGKNMAQVWSLATGEKVGVGMSHPGDEFGLWAIKFSPDGTRVATGHKDGRVRTFDWQTGEVVGTPLQHPDEVVDVAFTPDGRHLLVGVRQATLHVWDVATGKLAVPLLPQLSQDGLTTQSMGVAGHRAVVNSNTLYSVLDLSTLLPPIEEELPSLLRRAELATNQKLQVGELVPLESLEWSTRWEQLVAARQTPEQVAESLAQALDAAADVSGSAQSLVIARASRRGLLEKLHTLRPKSFPLALAVALETSKQGRLDDALKLREQVLALLRTSQAAAANPKSTTDFQSVAPIDGLEVRHTELPAILVHDLARLLTIDAPRGRWLPLELTEVTATAEMKFTLQPNGFVLATSGGNATEPTTYTIRSRPQIKQLAALRLDAVPHPSLPSGGSGLFGGGFDLAEIRVHIRHSDGTGMPVTLSHAAADYVRPLDSDTKEHDGPWGVIDGNRSSRWDAWPVYKQPLWLVLIPDAPCDIAENDTLIVELDCGDQIGPAARLGHFRLSVSEDSRAALADELVAAVRQNDLHSDELLAAACLVHGEAQVALNVLQHAEKREAAKREGEAPAEPRTTKEPDSTANGSAGASPSQQASPSRTLLRALLLAAAQQQLGQREVAQQTVKAAVAESSLEPWPHSLTGFYQQMLRDGAELSLSDIIQKREQLAAKRAVEQVARAVEVELARLTQAIQLNPTVAAGYSARATYLARLGRWKESAADFNEVLKRQPTERIHWLNAANAHLMAGDDAVYRDLCSRMLAQFKDSDDPLAVTSLCKVCLLRPEAVELSAIPIEKLNAVATQELAAGSGLFSVPNSGLAAYRAGRFDEALAWLGKSPNQKGFVGAQVFATRAMAEEKLGRHDDAVKSLSLAEALIPDLLADLGTPRFKGTLPVAESSLYRDNLTTEILRREAALLIHKDEARTTRFVSVPTSTPKTRDEWAALGEWAEAAKVAATEMARNPRSRVDMSRLAALQLLAGDVEGYRQTCASGLATFSGKLTTDEAESLTKTCLLGASAVEHSRLPIKQLREAVDDPTLSYGRYYWIAGSALAAYRAGEWELVLRESQKRTTFSGNTGAMLLVIRALAEEKLGQHEPALKSLQQAETIIPAELRTLGTAAHPGPLPVAASTVQVDWLIPEVLRREAGHLIRGDAFAEPRMTSLLESAEFKQASLWEQFAMQGQWAAAAKAVEPGLKQSPTERTYFAATAALLMMAGDVEGHRQFCDRALKPFEPVTAADVADSLCKASLLAPDAISLDRLPIKVLRDGIADPKNESAQPYFLASHTLVLYRAGQYAEAIEESKKIPQLTNVVGALTLVSRAMSEEKLGQHEQAVRTLFEAEALIPAELSTLGTDKHKGPAVISRDKISTDWLIPEVLRREAAKLIRK